MTSPQRQQFNDFFHAVYGYNPFPWQTRLAKRVCNGDWPRAIALPTAAGKTACIDIAVFALACRVIGAPRRIFFVVDRRIVVDQAKMHADQLATLLREASSGILKDVADSLRELAQDQRPLDVYALRGGMYRETAWTRSPLQPTVIASTVDQVGSRLLFRGYGVSDSMKPIHAALVGNDALILLDEAHCAEPFDQTMEAVKNYRGWNESSAPFCFVSMTATPPEEIREAEEKRKQERPNAPTLIEFDDAEDRADPELGKRIAVSKPARLVVAEKAKGKGKNSTSELVKVLEKCARELSSDRACVGIIVNRVKTARELKAQFGEDAVLLTGRMRPLDRDKLFDEKLRPLLSNAEGTPPRFVIGTQCLECGADFDFHALVTECASLDALRQRFGRLNRVGNRPTAKAVIVIRGDEVEDTSADPVYGASLANTWKWLESKATGEVFDFGVSAVRTATAEVDLVPLNAPTEDALLLFPAHLDCLVQTNPIPMPDPDPAWFLHGPTKPGQPDVQVVFRNDLGGDPEKMWADIVSLCPPSTSEAVTVPIGVFKKWLAGAPNDDKSGDMEGETATPDDDKDDPAGRFALCWQGPAKSWAISDPEMVRPNKVYVIPCSAPDVASFCDFIGEVPTDYAEEAFQRSRDKALLRLPALVIPEDSERPEAILVTEAIQAIEEKLSDDAPEWLRTAVVALKAAKNREVDQHPLVGYVVTGKGRLHKFDPTYLDDSEPAESFRGQPVTLIEHSSGVAEHAKRFAAGCGLNAELYYQVGLWHDLGKLDPRFQAMLKQSSPRTAVGDPIAKSARSPRTKRERDEAREVHRYPVGGRHELLSVALVATKTDDDVLLHLIATHHGSGRPLADSVEENDKAQEPFKPKLFGETFDLSTSAQQIATWNAELPERFWRMVRKFGWWGTAYQEAIFRLADHAQSRAEQEKEKDKDKDRKQADVKPPPFPQFVGRPKLHPLPLAGLDGANPLAFLAALGTLVVLDRIARSVDCPTWLAGTVGLSWKGHTPILHLPGPPPAPEMLVECLVAHCAASLDEHPAKFVVDLFENEEGLTSRMRRFVRGSALVDRASLDWLVAHVSEIVRDPKNKFVPSQLVIVRRDYFPDNVRSILRLCEHDHVLRALFSPWDYADALDNQSLHWEPSEDRRHAYRWHRPSGDKTLKTRGGMLGANRLALEAWALFPSFPAGDRLATRGFKGNRAANTFWTWPLWRQPLTRDAVASFLGIPDVQEDEDEFSPRTLRDFGVSAVFRLQRILVGKTPNFTTALALA